MRNGAPVVGRSRIRSGLTAIELAAAGSGSASPSALKTGLPPETSDWPWIRFASPMKSARKREFGRS